MWSVIGQGSASYCPSGSPSFLNFWCDKGCTVALKPGKNTGDSCNTGSNQKQNLLLVLVIDPEDRGLDYQIPTMEMCPKFYCFLFLRFQWLFLLADLEIICSTAACRVYIGAARRDCCSADNLGLSKKKLRALWSSVATQANTLKFKLVGLASRVEVV